MAFCEKCGTKLGDDEKFCSGCGVQLNSSQNSAPLPDAASKKETQKPCTKCGKILSPEWLICPYCKTETGPKLCTCGKELEEEWVVCPYCKAEV